MGVHRCAWVRMGVCVHAYMGLYACPWMHGYMNGGGWGSMGVHGCAWGCMGVHGYVGECVFGCMGVWERECR